MITPKSVITPNLAITSTDFLKSEDCQTPDAPQVDMAHHGTGGPLSTSVRQPVNPLAAAFVKACNQAEYKSIDYNGTAHR